MTLSPRDRAHTCALLIARARAALDALPDEAMPEAVEWLEDMATYWAGQVRATVVPLSTDLLRRGYS
jgi:hypothetical protein